jgi:uncharacterized protein
VKALREYNIPYVGLKVGVHTYEFEINDKFFSLFEDSPISKCDVKVKLEFDKKEALFVLNFFIDGKVMVECDRCLAPYEKEIFADYTCYVKFAEDPDKLPEDDEVIYISRDESHIDVSQLIYEYIVLSLPIRKIPCRVPGEDERCNKEVLKFLQDSEAANEEQKGNDPRWSALKKFKN